MWSHSSLQPTPPSSKLNMGAPSRTSQPSGNRYWNSRPIRKACEISSSDFHCETHYPKLVSVQEYQEMQRRGELKNYKVSEKLLKEESKNKF